MSESAPGKRQLPTSGHNAPSSKRPRNGRPEDANAPKGRFHDMFEAFRDELDEHHDRKDRIGKVSRDVTAHSKKIIFALQRVKKPNTPFPPNIQKDITTRTAEITTLLSSILPDLQSLNRYRYAWSLRCLEELVEALSFSHYLLTQTLISPAAIQSLPDCLPEGLELTPNDYLYGVFDLFGEMMRFATVMTAQTGELPGGLPQGEKEGGGDDAAAAGGGGGDTERRHILADMQQLGCAFELLPEIPTKDFRGKMAVMRQSVQKVERLGYGLVVRGSERPKGWVPDMKDEAPEPESPIR